MKFTSLFSSGATFSAVFSAAAVVALGLTLSACSTPQMDQEKAPPAGNTQTPTSRPYTERIEQFSDGDVEYSGLYNNFEYKATLLNSTIREALLGKQAAYYEWNDAQTSQAREKSNQEMSSQTKVFLAFFTPNAKNDNLTDSKTIWRIYLDCAGRRYEGKATRLRLLLAELQALYPYVTRWATPYELTFDVPTAAIESQPSTLTITGPLGSRVVHFKAM
jgi:hypothetical protein